jgi:hypothetical protein
MMKYGTATGQAISRNQPISIGWETRKISQYERNQPTIGLAQEQRSAEQEECHNDEAHAAMRVRIENAGDESGQAARKRGNHAWAGGVIHFFPWFGASEPPASSAAGNE